MKTPKAPRPAPSSTKQNVYTTRYLKQDPIRNQALDDLDPLEHTSRWTIPIAARRQLLLHEAPRRRRAGLHLRAPRLDRRAFQRQQRASPKDERLIDPAAFSRDPNTSVRLAAVSRDGMLLAYEVRQGGADEATVRIFSMAKKKPLEDELPAGLYYSLDFSPDGKGLYYARTDRKGTLLYLHVIGTRNADDKLIFGREFHGELLGPIDLFRAADHRRRALPRHHHRARRAGQTRRHLFPRSHQARFALRSSRLGLDSRFSAIYARGAWYVRTDYSSPNGRILRADPGIMPEAWKTIVPEGKDVLETFSIVGDKIYVKRLHDVKSEISVYTLDGKPAGQVDLEGIGSASGVAGRTTDRYGFFSFESWIQPPTIYRIDTATGKRELFAQPKVPFDTAQYDLKQVFYKSTDGTADPHVHRRQKGPAAGRLRAPADDRLRRLQPQRDADVEPCLGLVAPAGRILRGAQHARRRRVRRKLARAGNVREEAERL